MTAIETTYDLAKEVGFSNGRYFHKPSSRIQQWSEVLSLRGDIELHCWPLSDFGRWQACYRVMVNGEARYYLVR